MDATLGERGASLRVSDIEEPTITYLPLTFFILTAANSLNKFSFGEQILGLDGGLICCCIPLGD